MKLAAATVLAVTVVLVSALGLRSSATGVILITLDTTRVDRLSPYGFRRAKMPALDRLAREGVVFDQAVTVSPLTLPAHTTLFTGLLPQRHGVRENASPALAEDQVTLAEVLAEQGFETAAFVGSAVLDPGRGLRQGFQVYGGVELGPDAFRSPGASERRAHAVIDDAITWLETLDGERFFLWTHLYDPHRPYDAPQPFASQHEPYVAEIAYADSQIARLLAVLEQRHLLNRVVVVVTADHGEALGEHGELDHGVFLYESVLRVPLIVRAPGLPPRRVTSQARLSDIVPTVLDLLEIPAPPVDGISLTEGMRGSDAELDAYAESVYPAANGWAPIFALRTDRFKLIEAPQPELYDVVLDPGERRNLVADRPVLVQALRQRLHGLQGEKPAHVVSRMPSIDADLRERLAALGYVSPAPLLEPGSPRSGLPDAKKCSGIFESGRCRSPGASSASIAPLAH
jgi:arylsulfatase A-like enzyme